MLGKLSITLFTYILIKYASLPIEISLGKTTFADLHCKSFKLPNILLPIYEIPSI